MACSNCGDYDHNIQTCPKVRRCSVCGKAGHNAATCEYRLNVEENEADEDQDEDEVELELELEELELDEDEDEDEDEVTVIIKLITGHLSIVEKKLMKFSKFLTKDVKQFKIGITNNPPFRFAQNYINEYEKMYVIYRTKKHAYTQNAERALINFHKHDSRCANKRHGGGGNIGCEAPYYVYIVINT